VTPACLQFLSLGKIEGLFITTPSALVAYILSNIAINCLFFKQNSVRRLPPINAPKVLGGGKVGVCCSVESQGVGKSRFAESVKAAGMADGGNRHASIHELSTLNISRMMEYANYENPRWFR